MRPIKTEGGGDTEILTGPTDPERQEKDTENDILTIHLKLYITWKHPGKVQPSKIITKRNIKPEGFCDY